MTPANLQRQLSQAFPNHRWLPEPTAQFPTVTTTIAPSKTLTITKSASGFDIRFYLGGTFE
jgi:hypothetical protein